MTELINEVMQKYLNEKFEKESTDLTNILTSVYNAGLVEGLKQGRALARKDMIELLQGDDE
jgi:hypothetical protein